MVMHPFHIHQVYGNTPHIVLSSVSALMTLALNITTKMMLSNSLLNYNNFTRSQLIGQGHTTVASTLNGIITSNVDLSMPKYIPNVLQQFAIPQKSTSSPFQLSATTSSHLTKIQSSMIHLNFLKNKKQHKSTK